ncbi:MAG: hypothetical protein KC636_08965, partial [Myxococcales bacterium]|nr:hypothetical protein [Myxococcales bacterium]
MLVGSLLGLCSCQGGSDGATTDATTDGATTDATATTIAGSSGSSDATTHGSEGETATNATTTGDATQTTTSDDTDASDSDLTDASDTAVDRCGDGVIDDGEDCDDGGESASCDSDCTPAVCGDGTHNASAGEGCDDGGESASCDADCSVATCGDGAINHSAGERCDDGNRDALDGCELDCQPTRSGRIAVSSTHSCALVDGGVACWGYNASGQLGYGNKEHLGDDPGELPTSPVDIDGVVVEVAAGQGHTCVLLDTGDVRCWGFNHHGQLGLGHTETIGDDELPSDVGVISLGAPAVHIIAGFFHSCALLEGGALRCWGHGETGQLGAGDDQDIGDDELPSDVAPVDVGGVITQLDGGRFHTCALLEGGVVRCWGAGAQGQLGYGNVNNVGDGPGEMPPQDVDVGGVAIQIATGNEHSCALLEGGGVRCWGDGGTGQLGTGSTKDIGDDEVPSTVGLVSVGGPAARL